MDHDVRIVEDGGMRNRALALVSLGLLTFTVSESVFWGGLGRAYADAGVLMALFAYTVVVVAVVYVLERSQPGGWEGVFLAGALVGWVIEGTVVNTVYLALPVSISWTGLAWHALLSVLGAWVLLPRLLVSRWRWAGSVGVGAVWGGWGSAMQLDEGELESPGAFALYVAIATVALGLGLRGWLRHRDEGLVPDWLGRSAVVLAVAAWGIQIALTPLALVLVPLVGLALWALWRRRNPLAVPTYLSGPSSPPVAPLGAMALTAVLVQATIGSTVAPLAAALVYFGTITVGFVLLARTAITRSSRRRQDPGPVTA